MLKRRKKTIEIGFDSNDMSSFIVPAGGDTGELCGYAQGYRLPGQAHHRLRCGKGVYHARCDQDGKAGIPVLSTPEQVADALAIMYRHQKRVKELGAKE